MNIYDAKHKLLEYAEHSNDEIGDACTLLCRLHDLIFCFDLDEFQNALKKEIFHQLDWFQSFCEIVEKEETIKRKVKVVKCKSYEELD